MKVTFDIPTLAPSVVIRVKTLTEEAEVKFQGKEDKAKKDWVVKEAMPLLKGALPKKIPIWLHGPIKKAVLSVMVDTLWALNDGE